MKLAAIALGLVCLLAAATPVVAAEKSVKADTLKHAGLSGMKPLSDHEGMAVRGMYVATYSSSFATFFGVSQYSPGVGPAGFKTSFASVGGFASAGGGAVAFAH